MNDVNKRCKTFICLFIKVQRYWSPAGKYDCLNLSYSSLFKASGQIDTLIVYEKFSFKG